MPPERPSCLVIGARGFVGSAFVRQARAGGFAVSEGTRENLASLAGQRFDLIVNAAGNARKYLARRDPEFDRRATVEAVEHSLRAFSCARYLLISSVDVYPDPSRVEATREELELDPAALDSYGRHRLLAERAVIEGAPSWLILRLAQMLGPGLVKGPIFDLSHDRPLWVDPASRYPFLRTDKVATIGLALAMDGGNQRYNLCGTSAVSLHEAAAILGRDPARLRCAEPAPRRESYAIATAKLEAIHPLPRSLDELRAFAS